MERSVVIIGAGISGLMACKYTVEKGFNPVVFEAKSSFGEVWLKHSIQSTDKLDNIMKDLEFSDFDRLSPPRAEDEFSTHVEVFEYIMAYAEKFGLLPCIRLNCQATGLRYVGESEQEMDMWDRWCANGTAFGSAGKWHVQVHNKETDSIEEHQTEFVILCVGHFTGLPELPPGQSIEQFHGQVLDSMLFSALEDLRATEMIKRKRITVVGSGKLEGDIATECAITNGPEYPCTMIQSMPDSLLPAISRWSAPISYLYSKQSKYLDGLIAFMSSSLSWSVSKFVKCYLRLKLPPGKFGMAPNLSFLQKLFSRSMARLPKNIYDNLENGSIILKRSRGFRFVDEGVVIEEEDRQIGTDLMILATGYRGDKKLISLLEFPISRRFIGHSPASVIPLYRQTIHPRIPRFAVIGHTDSMSNLLSFKIRCRWLAHFLDGKFQLPGIREMEKNVKAREGHLKPEIDAKQNHIPVSEIFACPICYKPLTRKGPPGLKLESYVSIGFDCMNCDKTYSGTEYYLDLTLVSRLKEYREIKPAGTELFRFRLVSVLYERGWRQSFKGGGFPGANEEFEMARRHFKAAEGGVLVDVSCGSGLFSRRFAKSGAYSEVIALDFSENMLRQCYEFIKSDCSAMDANLVLVRADVARLPFVSGSVDAVHAGAALHCWPSPSNAIAEITRVLRSGGIFVGTSFLRYNPNSPRILRFLKHVLPTNYIFLTAEEIEDVCTSCGLTNYTSEIRHSFIMFSAQKP